MSIQSEIDRLQAAKSAIAAALQAMGVEPPQGTTLDQYAAQLTAIAASAPWLPLAGGTMTGNVDLENDACLSIRGDGALNIGGSESGPNVSIWAESNGQLHFDNTMLIGIVSPTVATAAANKEYVDGLVGNINSVLDAINGEVV